MGQLKLRFVFEYFLTRMHARHEIQNQFDGVVSHADHVK